jgi:hypothetical protein
MTEKTGRTILMMSRKRGIRLTDNNCKFRGQDTEDGSQNIV